MVWYEPAGLMMLCLKALYLDQLVYNVVVLFHEILFSVSAVGWIGCGEHRG